MKARRNAATSLEEACENGSIRKLMIYPPDDAVFEISQNFRVRTQKVVELIKERFPWYWAEYRTDLERIYREGPDPGKPKDVEYLASYWRYRAQQLQERLLECQGKLAAIKKALQALETPNRRETG